MKIAYFTAGTTGAGHLVRGLAVGRGLRRAGFSGDYRVFGPPLPFPLTRRQPYETVEVRREELRSPLLAPESELADQLASFGPDLLLVDMFWAPLRYVLPRLDCERWLLIRCCPPAWFRGPRVAPFEPSQYDRIVGIEPVDYPVLSCRIDPIVIANPDECRPPEALRQRFGVADGQRLVAVLHAGKAGEIEELEARAPGARFVRLDLFDDEALFPAAEWLSGADAVVCGAGYNAYWEARWLGYAAATTFLPFARRIDDQTLRLRDFGSYRMVENGADTLARWIVG